MAYDRPLRTDLELLDRWRAGDKVAGDALVARHWDGIARFFRHKIGDDGADLISQTFLACIESAAPIENVRAFLFTVARRRLADAFRSRARAPELDFAPTAVTWSPTASLVTSSALRPARIFVEESTVQATVNPSLLFTVTVPPELAVTAPCCTSSVLVPVAVLTTNSPCRRSPPS